MCGVRNKEDQPKTLWKHGVSKAKSLSTTPLRRKALFKSKVTRKGTDQVVS